MLLSDLLGCLVLGPDGEAKGRVVDVRFRRGPARRAHEGRLELIALIVSPRTRLSFYGYERGRVQRPAAIAAIVRRMHRGSQVIPWECVGSIEDGRGRLTFEPPSIPLDVRLPTEEP
jgi:hypothetical protein